MICPYMSHINQRENFTMPKITTNFWHFNPLFTTNFVIILHINTSKRCYNPFYIKCHKMDFDLIKKL